MSTQNMDSNPQAAFPSLCSNGCGFFSTTDKEGLCSVCFKEKLKKEAESQQGPPTTSSSTQTPPPPPPPSETSSGPSSGSLPQQPQASSSTSNTTPDLKETTLSESVAENSNVVSSEDLARPSEAAETSPRKTPHPADEDSDPPVPAKKAKKNRCLSCKKKLGLTGFTCRCGGQFCSLHRYSDKHECPFDYKAMGEQEISQNNPQIVAQKVAKL